MINVTENDGKTVLVNPQYVGFVWSRNSEGWNRCPERDKHPECNSVMLYESDKIFCKETIDEICEKLQGD